MSNWITIVATGSLDLNPIKNMTLFIWISDVKMHANSEKSLIIKSKFIIPSTVLIEKIGTKFKSYCLLLFYQTNVL